MYKRVKSPPPAFRILNEVHRQHNFRRLMYKLVKSPPGSISDRVPKSKYNPLRHLAHIRGVNAQVSVIFEHPICVASLLVGMLLNLFVLFVILSPGLDGCDLHNIFSSLDSCCPNGCLGQCRVRLLGTYSICFLDGLYAILFDQLELLLCFDQVQADFVRIKAAHCNGG